MTIKNPEYNPNWKKLYAHHAAESKRLREIPFDDLTEEQHAEMEDHSAQLRRCLDTYQHETLADAAKWVFERFDPAALAGLEGLIQPIDHDAFTSMDEIKQAWKDTDNAVQIITADQRSSLPIGQPLGIGMPRDLFCDIGGNLNTALKVFSNIWFINSEVMTTTDRRDDTIYICFLDNHEGVSVVNAIDHFATVMHHNVIKSLEIEKKQQRSQVWAADKVVPFFQGSSKSTAPKLVFFQHLPPKDGDKETFSLVDLTFSNGIYKDPRWTEFDRIPEYLQKLRRARDLALVTRPSLNLLTRCPS